MELTQLIGIFLTGLLAGGLSCMAVQGGLLTATLAQQHSLEKDAKKGEILPIVSFLIAKLIAYTFLGFFLGWVGSLFQISFILQVTLQFFVGIFLLGTALNMLHVHPVFRYFVIQPPHFLTRLLLKETKSKRLFAPAFLGAFTVFIPCGATQAIMAISIASGNPLTGALILFAFILGTSPIFFLLGYITTKLGQAMKSAFNKVAATAIVLLALFTINNAVALTGSNVTFEYAGKAAWCLVSYCREMNLVGAANDAAITINQSGYTPHQLTVRAGKPVTLHLTNVSGEGCTQAFTIPQLGLQKIVPVGKSETIHFTAPQKPGQLAFMCSMGMYRGTITVI